MLFTLFSHFSLVNIIGLVYTRVFSIVFPLAHPTLPFGPVLNHLQWVSGSWLYLWVCSVCEHERMSAHLVNMKTVAVQTIPTLGSFETLALGSVSSTTHPSTSLQPEESSSESTFRTDLQVPEILFLIPGFQGIVKSAWVWGHIDLISIPGSALYCNLGLLPLSWKNTRGAPNFWDQHGELSKKYKSLVYNTSSGLTCQR